MIMKKEGEIPKKKSHRQILRESEQRNIALVEYIEVLENICRTVCDKAARRYEDLSLIVTPGTVAARDTLAQICVYTAPICQDVEKMNLPQFAIDELIKKGGTVVQENIPDEPEKGAEDGKSGT